MMDHLREMWHTAAMKSLTGEVTIELVEGDDRASVWATLPASWLDEQTSYMRGFYWQKTRSGRIVVGQMAIIDAGHAQGDTRPLKRILMVDIHERFHRQGLATKMYLEAKRWADRHGYRLAHDDSLSPDAKAWIPTLPGEQWGLDKPTKTEPVNHNTDWVSEWSLKRLGKVEGS